MDLTGNELADSATSWVMVRDNVTGLIWETKESLDNFSDYDSIHDADNQYTWCDTSTTTNGGNQGSCDGNNTEEFITILNTNAFGGYTDWRIPTINELATLINYAEHNPSISTKYFPATATSSYWSATTYSGNSSYALLIYFILGDDYQKDKSTSYYVRAVRGGK